MNDDNQNPNSDPSNTNPTLTNNKSSMVLAAEERRKNRTEQQMNLNSNNGNNLNHTNQMMSNKMENIGTNGVMEQQTLRMDLIQKAIQFLNNPTVRDTPASRKMAFLKEKKGMTQQEIEEAFRLTNTEMHDSTLNTQINKTPSYQQQSIQQQPLLSSPQSIQSAPLIPPRENRDSGWKNTLLTVAATVGVVGMGIMVAKVKNTFFFSFFFFFC